MFSLGPVSRKVGAVVRASDQRILGTFFLVDQCVAVSSAHVLLGLSISDVKLFIGEDQLNFSADWKVLGSLVYFSVEPGTFFDWLLVSEAPVELCDKVVVPGFCQSHFGEEFATLRVLTTSVVGFRSRGTFAGNIELQGSFPVGYSGAPVIACDSRVVGVLDGMISLPCRNNQAFDFCIAVPAAGNLFSSLRS